MLIKRPKPRPSHLKFSREGIWLMIYALGKFVPRISENAYVMKEAFVAGRVTLGKGTSVWPGAVLRGDVNEIIVGDRTNIQDNAVLHVEHTEEGKLVIGSNVTIGHSAVLHACVVEEACLIGMGAVVLDGAVVGHHSIVAAGALVAPGMNIPPGSLVMGSPARIKRSLREEEMKRLEEHAKNYVRYAEETRKNLRLISE